MMNTINNKTREDENREMNNPVATTDEDWARSVQTAMLTNTENTCSDVTLESWRATGLETTATAVRTSTAE